MGQAQQLWKDDMPARLARLSDGQKDCLRLVGLYHSSKEAARILGISPHTVDQRLKRAIAILGVSSRAEAARMLMQHEGASPQPFADEKPYQELVYQELVLPESALSATQAPPSSFTGRNEGSVGGQLHEVQGQYFPEAPFQTVRPSILSTFVAGVGENRLGTGARLGIIILIALLCIMGFAGMISIAEGLSRLI